MNIRTILICLSALGLASGSRASTISHAVLGNEGLSGTAHVVAPTSKAVQAPAGRSDRAALKLVSRHARLHGSRVTSGSTHTIANKGDATSPLPPPSSVDLQDMQTPGVSANTQTSRTPLFPANPSGTSHTNSSGAVPGPVYGGSSEMAGSGYTSDFRPLTQGGNENGQLPTGPGLCGSPCLAGGPSSYASSTDKYQLTPGAHDLIGSAGQMYMPVSKPAGSVAMPEPDMSLLLIFDIAFLVGAVTFLRSKYGDKKTMCLSAPPHTDHAPALNLTPGKHGRPPSL
jgi:hypothetical protein